MFAVSEKFFIGNWIFETDHRIITLEIKENNEILYYEQIKESNNILSENRFEGTYQYQKNNKPKNYELSVVYNMAEYSPYSFVNGMPTSYADYNVIINSIITINKSKIGKINVSFLGEEKGYIKKETLKMKRYFN